MFAVLCWLDKTELPLLEELSADELTLCELPFTTIFDGGSGSPLQPPSSSAMASAAAICFILFFIVYTIEFSLKLLFSNWSCITAPAYAAP